MGVREGGDLRQVGDHDDLGAPGQPGEPPPDLHRGLPANPGVHLVEHERRHRVGAGEDDLDGEHHPGQLAAGGSLGERQRGRARVRGQPDLHLVRAVRAELVPRRDHDADLRVRHGERGEFRGDLGREPFRRLLAQRGQLGGRGRGPPRRAAPPRRPASRSGRRRRPARRAWRRACSAQASTEARSGTRRSWGLVQAGCGRLRRYHGRPLEPVQARQRALHRRRRGAPRCPGAPPGRRRRG